MKLSPFWLGVLAVICATANAAVEPNLPPKVTPTMSDTWRAVLRPSTYWTAPEPIDGIADMHQAGERLGSNTPAYYEWLERYYRMLRDRGLEAWDIDKSASRYVWLSNTVSQRPNYWKDIRQGAFAYAAGTPHLTARDEEAIRAWEIQYIRLRSEFMTDSKVSMHHRALLRFVELRALMDELIPYRDRFLAIANKNLGKVFNAWWDYSTSEGAWNSVSLADRMLQFVQYEHAAEVVMIDALKVHPEMQIREFAGRRDAVRKLSSSPIECHIQTMDGTVLDLARLRGKVVLLDFWFSNCSGCIEALPHIREVYERYKEKGFEVIGICFERETERKNVEAIIERNGITWPQSIQGYRINESGLLKERFGIVSAPAYFLFDQNGLLVSSDSGLGHRELLEEKVSYLLSNRPEAITR